MQHIRDISTVWLLCESYLPLATLLWALFDCRPISVAVA